MKAPPSSASSSAMVDPSREVAHTHPPAIPRRENPSPPICEGSIEGSPAAGSIGSVGTWPGPSVGGLSGGLSGGGSSGGSSGGGGGGGISTPVIATSSIDQPPSPFVAEVSTSKRTVNGVARSINA